MQAPISVDSGCEIRNVLCWHVRTDFDLSRPTSIFINPRDCEGRSVDRETEFTAANAPRTAKESWVDYHVGMWKLHNHNVACAPSNAYDDHDAATLRRL